MIKINFDILNTSHTTQYSFEGKENCYLEDYFGQTLFWDEIKFEIPEKPFDLEIELRNLKRKEFKTTEINYFLIWNNKFKKIDYDAVKNNEQPCIKYFTEQSIKDFVENIKT